MITPVISEIQVVPILPQNGLVAFASITFDSCLRLGSIGIFTRPQGGYRLTYPTRNKLNVFYPINREVAGLIEEAVIAKYEEVIKLGDKENDL